MQQAAPDAFVQIATEDAARYNIADGDMVEVESRRGRVREPALVGGIEPGHVFIPFHYGYWDDDQRPRAANELTLTEWDPVSKQPHFKYAAVRLRKLQPLSTQVAETLSSVADTATGVASAVVSTVTGSRKEA